MYTSAAYGQPEDSLNQDVIATVEKSMKKYADNLMRFLEGISSRLSQLELYCYNLDKSIGEMRSDLNRDHGEADSKLKSLEKHLQEVSCNTLSHILDCLVMFSEWNMIYMPFFFSCVPIFSGASTHPFTASKGGISIVLSCSVEAFLVV